MNSKEDAQYRVNLSQEYLENAQKNVKLEMWSSCVGNALLSRENAAKAIIACFEPVEHTHAPAIQLRRLNLEKKIPKLLLKEVKEILPFVSKEGEREHFLVEYGDEMRYLTPSKIFKKTDALKSLKVAKSCLKVAEEVLRYKLK